MSEPTNTDKELTRALAMYADAVLTLASVRTAAQAVVDGIVPHPSFQKKTRLIWAEEITELERVLKSSEIAPPTGECLALLQGRDVPTYEEAVQMVTWIRGMMRLPDGEQKALRAKIDELGRAAA